MPRTERINNVQLLDAWAASCWDKARGIGVTAVAHSGGLHAYLEAAGPRGNRLGCRTGNREGARAVQGSMTRDFAPNYPAPMLDALDLLETSRDVAPPRSESLPALRMNIAWGAERCVESELYGSPRFSLLAAKRSP